MEVVIDRFGINGEGVFNLKDGQNKGKVCFVDFALPKEKVDISITQERSKFSIAKLNKIIAPSSDRVEPKCKYFGICGGCDIQHINTDCQEEFKKKKIIDTIYHITKNKHSLDGFFHLNDYYYRNKMVFPINYSNGKNTIGMFAKNSRDIVDIDECLIANDRINEVLTLSREFFAQGKMQGYDFHLKTGVCKYLVIRECGNGILVTIVATRKIDCEEFYNYLSSRISSIGLSIIIGDNDDRILEGKYIHLYGLEKLDLCEFGVKYSIDNLSFLQVNSVVKDEIYKLILENIDCSDKVIDAYSGAGLLSAIMASKCKSVVGIEINRSASRSAIDLAKSNNIDNISFINGDVKDKLREYLVEDSVVVFDPPRSGCDRDVLDIILSKDNPDRNISPSKIIYVSCNPSTFARDYGILSEKYTISKLYGLDMFPNSKHIELLAVFNLKK